MTHDCSQRVPKIFQSYSFCIGHLDEWTEERELYPSKNTKQIKGKSEFGAKD